MSKINSLLLDFKNHWRNPKENQYVSYSEISSFCIGGMGMKAFQSLVGYISIAPTCLLVASIYQLSPRDLMILFVITNIVGVLKTPIVSAIIDNTKTKMGKFRPYILWAGIPTMLSVVALTWFVPINASPTVKLTLVGIYINILYIFQPIYNNAYIGISQTITPNSSERTNILSISELLGNLGPSIVQFILPTLSGLFYGKDGMLDIRTYRIFFPIISIIGFSLGLLVMYKTRERVIETHNNEENYEKISIINGIKYLSKNKYFWIVTISKLFDGFKGGLGMLLGWICAYQLSNSSMQGILQTIVSVGYTPGILLAPLLIKKLGAKNAAFSSNFLNCVTALIMLCTFKNGVAFFIISLFLYNFAQGPQYIMQNTILSNGFDYQQNKDNIRLEGFALNFQQMIASLGNILATVIFTFIYEKNGLIKDAVTGLTDYSILRDDAIRNPIISSVIVVVIITSFAAAVPYLFYDLSHKDMEKIKQELEAKTK